MIKPGFLAALAAVVLLSPVSALPQDSDAKPADSHPQFTVKKTTRLVVTNVIVRDKSGNPVRGLKSSDFVISENGKKQNVGVFAFLDNSVPEKSEPPKSLPPNMLTNRPTVPIGDGRATVLLIDRLNTTREEQGTTRDQLLRFIELYDSVRPIAIFSLGIQLGMLQDFTTDKHALMTALQKFQPSTSPGSEEARWAYDLPAPSSAQGAAAVLRKLTDMQDARIDLRAGYTVSGLRGLAQLISEYPGRKSVVWLSSSFPINLGVESLVSDRVAAAGDPFYEIPEIRKQYDLQVQSLGNFLANNNVALYTVDTHLLGTPGTSPGDTGPGFTAADTMRSTFGTPLSGADVQDELAKHSQRMQANQATMKLLADETGGRAYINRNDMDAQVKKAVDDGSVYYTIGYYAAAKFDGSFRKIQISIPHHDYDMTYRKGYFATDYSESPGEQKESTQRMLAALKLGMVPSTELLFNATMVPQDGHMVMKFALDMDRVDFSEEAAGARQGQFDVAAVFYQDGKAVQSDEFTLNVKLPEKAYRRALSTGGITISRPMSVAKGTYTVRLAVRDLHTGRIGSLEAPIALN